MSMNCRKYNIFQLFCRFFKQIFFLTPFFTLAKLIMATVHGAVWALIPISTNLLYDTAESLFNGYTNIIVTIGVLVQYAFVLIISQACDGFDNFLDKVHFNKVYGFLLEKINDKVKNLSPISFEETEMLNSINKAENGASQAYWMTLQITWFFTYYLAYFVVTSIYLYNLKPIFVFSIILIFIPTICVQIMKSKTFSDLEEKSVILRREYKYYEDCLVDSKYFAETRNLGAYYFFKEKYINKLEALNSKEFRTHLKTSCLELIMKFITLIGYGSIYIIVINALLNKEISAGSFAAVFSSIGMMYLQVNGIICVQGSSISKNLGLVKNYANFMDLPERQGVDVEIGNKNDIVLENVSFSYPNSEKKELDNITLTIKDKETVALVGENGAGKSTLIKVILGLYHPQSGNVYYDENNINNIISENIFHNSTAVFQNFQKYKLTLRENIGISEANRNVDNKSISELLQKVNYQIEEDLMNDYDTILSREFDGVELSGGQWQRIAIARALFRIHDLIILDEPTSAIDPIEETKIYENFAEISKDKTAILVTHRLGSVKIADRILVMDKGKIIASGNHKTLLDKCEKYYEMWRAQAKMYMQD